MKIKHFVSVDKRRDNTELIDYIKKEFGNEEVNTSIDDKSILLGDKYILYTIHNNPLVIEGHTFESLRDFWVTYTFEDGSTEDSKHVDLPWSNKRICEVALVAYCRKYGPRQRTGSIIDNALKEKIKAERQILKDFRKKY